MEREPGSGLGSGDLLSSRAFLCEPRRFGLLWVVISYPVPASSLQSGPDIFTEYLLLALGHRLCSYSSLPALCTLPPCGERDTACARGCCFFAISVSNIFSLLDLGVKSLLVLRAIWGWWRNQATPWGLPPVANDSQ